MSRWWEWVGGWVNCSWSVSACPPQLATLAGIYALDRHKSLCPNGYCEETSHGWRCTIIVGVGMAKVGGNFWRVVVCLCLILAVLPRKGSYIWWFCPVRVKMEKSCSFHISESFHLFCFFGTWRKKFYLAKLTFDYSWWHEICATSELCARSWQRSIYATIYCHSLSACTCLAEFPGPYCMWFKAQPKTAVMIYNVWEYNLCGPATNMTKVSVKGHFCNLLQAVQC